jgi:peptide-methionine (S)-S-oxide reductase
MPLKRFNGMVKKAIPILLLIFVFLSGSRLMSQEKMENIKYETATFGSGCFWCTEAIFERVDGVIDVISGYAGGLEPNPSYELVCSGTTRYAEVTQITYNPEIVSFQTLLKIFWETHDPTTLNRQGADVGPQYRSVIFYHNQEQKEIAERLKNELNKAKIWDKPIVTEITPVSNFYKAENYHQNFYENNPSNSYCNFVITPKVKKFEKVFSNQLK